MEVIIQAQPREVSQVAAHMVEKLIKTKANCTLGLATGMTPLKLYEELINYHQKSGLDFSKVNTFNLDEYVGLGADHPGSYHRYMRENFFNSININLSQTFIPDGLATDIPRECLSYEKKIAQLGGIDLQILGIGSDGHIGFNEPSSSLASRTRIKTLTEFTRKNNALYFKTPEEVPFHVITMGIGTIMEARKCLLLAFGKSKARAIAQMIEGPVSSMVPASALQFHPNTTVVIDEEAASLLKHKSYYHWVYDRKPKWQRDL